MLGDILCDETRESYDLWTRRKTDLYLGLLIETDEQVVHPALQRVLDRLAKAPELDGATLIEKARFGFSSYPGDGITLVTLLAAATSDLRPLADLSESYSDAGPMRAHLAEPGIRQLASHSIQAAGRW